LIAFPSQISQTVARKVTHPPVTNIPNSKTSIDQRCPKGASVYGVEEFMNEILEQKLKDAMEEAERQRAGAVYVVLHLLLGNCLNSTHHKFAKHCCQYNPFGIESTSSAAVRQDDFADEGSQPVYHH
jgi:hypothetical protein